MNARWHEALDSQARAFGWLDSPRGRSYAKGWADSWDEGGEKVHGRTGKPISHTSVDLYRTYMTLLPDVVLAADTIYVEPDMMALVTAAAQSFEPEPLLPTDLPCPTGFLYLPEPIQVVDRHEKATSIRVFAWHTVISKISLTEPGADGIVLYLLHREGDQDDYSQPTSGTGLSPEDLTILHVFPWPFGLELTMETDVAGGLKRIARPLLTIWRLMQQTIAVSTRERPARHVRRRMPDPMVDNLVTVVRLRRPHKDVDPDHEPATVDWQQRWIVGGHWRQQWYPSINAHRQIWIAPYVKGPEDKPLVVRKARVLDFAR